MLLGFEVVAARPKSKPDDERDAPVQAPMRPTKMARNPSTDQKKVRRKLQRQAVETREADMHHYREADLLAAMSKATLAEQHRLAAELERLRSSRREASRAESETDLSDAVIRDTLTPVLTHSLHTTATDWLDEVLPGPTPDMERRVLAEASLFWTRLPDAVRADRDEFREQAQGMARRVASAFGEGAEVAHRAFLSHLGHLYRTAAPKTAEEDTTDGWPLDPNTDEKVDTTPWSEQVTTGDTQDTGDIPGITSTRTAADAKCRQCGKAMNPVDAMVGGGKNPICGSCARENQKKVTGADADKNPYPAHEQAGYGESGLPDEPDADEEPLFAEDWPGDDGSGHHPPMPGAGESTANLRTTAARPLYEIAEEVARDWRNVYFGAVPYLQAMHDLDSIRDMYGADDAGSIVSYFLSNATTWRGETAKRVKAELKAMLKERYGSLGGEWARRVAEDQNGQADSSLEDVEVGDEDDRPMWPWEMETAEKGAADVANVPTPPPWPQPTSKLQVFRDRVRAGLS